MDAIVVTISGYRGSERTKLIKLISSLGANYVGKMSRSITHLVCWEFKGGKYELAKKFGTLIVNHQWLVECTKKGKRIPESPYTRQSGQKVGLNILNLPVITETTGILSENKQLLTKSNMHDYLNDVIDLESDEIENDDWDDDLLLNENSFPRPRSGRIARQKSKRKLDGETVREDRQTKLDSRRAINEPQKPTADGLQSEVSDSPPICSAKQRRNDTDISMWPDLAESSRRSRRLVKKNDNRNIPEIATIDAEQQNRTNADANELTVSPSLSNDCDDLSIEIEARTRRRMEATSTVHEPSRDEVNNVNDLSPLLDTSLQGDDPLNKERSMEGTNPDVQPTVNAQLELSCVICWTDSSSIRGVLPCGHRFCFPCIQNWADHMASSRKESTCPLCKASFASITRVDAAASLDQKIYSQTIPCAFSSQHIYIVSEPRAYSENTLPSVCCQCQSREPEDLLMYCQVCQSSCIHHFCLDPPLFPWTCIGCRDRRLYFN